MSRLAKYKKIEAKHLAKLKAQKIKTVEDLWENIGAKSSGVDDLAKKVDLTGNDIIDILAECARPGPRSEGKKDRFAFWVNNYWPEGLGLVVVCLLFFLLLGNGLWKRDTVVVAGSALSAYHVISDNDVKVEKRFRTYGSFRTTEDVVGRYLLKPAGHGAILLSDQLGPKEHPYARLSGRPLLSVPVKAGAISQALAPYDRVRLLFSPRELGARPAAVPPVSELSVNDAVVLAINRQREAFSVVVAVKDEDDLARATLLLGTSDVFISQPAP